MFNESVTIPSGNNSGSGNDELIKKIVAIVEQRLTKGTDTTQRGIGNEIIGEAGVLMNAKPRIDGQTVGGK